VPLFQPGLQLREPGQKGFQSFGRPALLIDDLGVTPCQDLGLLEVVPTRPADDKREGQRDRRSGS
jgi:hypothetical protein